MLLQVVGLHKERYVFPFSIEVTKASGAGAEAIFVGVLRLLPDDPNAVRAVNAQSHLGPIAHGRQYQRVQSLIQQGIDEGAKLVCGGVGRPEGLENHLHR